MKRAIFVISSLLIVTLTYDAAMVDALHKPSWHLILIPVYAQSSPKTETIPSLPDKEAKEIAIAQRDLAVISAQRAQLEQQYQQIVQKQQEEVKKLKDLSDAALKALNLDPEKYEIEPNTLRVQVKVKK